MKAPSDAYSDWAGLQPKGSDPLELMEKYIKLQMQRRDDARVAAAFASDRVDWAWRKFCKWREEAAQR